MNYYVKLDKKLFYFTQNNTTIRLYCPECVRTKKVLRHCKIFKNLPALWWHIKNEHGEISNIDFNTNDLIYIFNAIDKAIQWHIIAF